MRCNTHHSSILIPPCARLSSSPPPGSSLPSLALGHVTPERLRKGACQVAYLSLGVCDMADREGKPAVVAVPWLSTNIGSRQATLAAKKA